MTTLHARSFFAGIGGFDIGFEATGEIEVATQVEWDANCQTILKRNYPTVELFGDICDVTAGDLCETGGPEVWAAGFPCQDTSIAAPKRLGLRGTRSHHYFEFVRLVAEYQRLLAERRPEWVVIENPPGILKSNAGRDMATVVRCLEELGYGWYYRVVDGRHFDLPGRRRRSPAKRERCLVVGHRSGDPRVARLVLGDRRAGQAADPTREVRRPPVGPAPAGRAGVGPIWRKSARPRASLAKGGYETWVSDGQANTLTGFDWGDGARQTHLLVQDGRLRTLTLLEWERLAGFPDGHTSGAPASARGQMLGNSFHPGMAYWLGGRFVAAQQALETA